jgi:hypothetical protein
MLTLVIFDVIASLASRALGFWYPYATIGSWLIYVATGVLAARVASISKAALAGAAVGFIEATLGWAVTWTIGPGRPESESLTVVTILVVVVLVTLVATGFGWLGGIVGRRWDAAR